MQSFQIGQLIIGKIEALNFGAEGILRYDGLVIFIPFTAIGDHIECQLTEVKSSFAKAVLIKIITPSSDRIHPRCPYFGKCGGCQIQHINDDAQNTYKLAVVKDSFKRIGHLSTDTYSFKPAITKWGYRRHITLHLRPTQNSFEMGYIDFNGTNLISIRTCPIFNPENDSLLHHIHSLLKKIPNPEQLSGRLTILKNKNNYCLCFSFSSAFLFDPTLFKAILNHYSFLSGIVVLTPQKKMTIGNIFCEVELEGLTFKFTPEAFIQNHPEQSANIYREILSLASKQKHSHILDLYCGFGISSLLLAKQGYHVTGIEYNATSIQLAKSNNQQNSLNAQFIRGDVEKILPNWFMHQTHKPSLVIVNPPRRGLTKQVIQTLLKFQPQEIIYISCMPPTLARDLNLLCKDIYTIEKSQVYDMFPQTSHVETCVHLKKR